MPRGIPKASVSAEEKERRQEKRQQALQERRRQRRRVLLHAGPWQVFCLDAFNYVLTDAPDNAGRYLYYPTFEDAAEMLLTKRFEQLARPGIEGLLCALKQAKAEVRASLKSGAWRDTDEYRAQ